MIKLFGVFFNSYFEFATAICGLLVVVVGAIYIYFIVASQWL